MWSGTSGTRLPTGVEVTPVGRDDVREVVPDRWSVEETGLGAEVDFRATCTRARSYDAHGVNGFHRHLLHEGDDRQPRVSHAAG